MAQRAWRHAFAEQGRNVGQHYSLQHQQPPFYQEQAPAAPRRPTTPHNAVPPRPMPIARMRHAHQLPAVVVMPDAFNARAVKVHRTVVTAVTAVNDMSPCPLGSRGVCF